MKSALLVTYFKLSNFSFIRLYTVGQGNYILIAFVVAGNIKTCNSETDVKCAEIYICQIFQIGGGRLDGVGLIFGLLAQIIQC